MHLCKLYLFPSSTRRNIRDAAVAISHSSVQCSAGLLWAGNCARTIAMSLSKPIVSLIGVNSTNPVAVQNADVDLHLNNVSITAPRALFGNSSIVRIFANGTNFLNSIDANSASIERTSSDIKISGDMISASRDATGVGPGIGNSCDSISFFNTLAQG
jgi:hypothetical protein